MLGNNGGAFVTAAAEQLFELRHRESALGLGGLMAALAVGLKNGPDLAVITHLRGGFGGGSFVPAAAALRRNQQRQRQATEQPNQRRFRGPETERWQTTNGDIHQ